MRPFLFLLALTASLSGQAPKEFEVASIKPDAMAPAQRFAMGLKIDGAQVTASQMSLRDLVRIAWRLKDYQVEAPEWLASERFDLMAKLPDGAKQSDVPEMLRNLLAERFQLKTHPSQKEFPVYALIANKGGPRLTPSEGEAPAAGAPVNVAVGASAAGTSVSLGNGSSFTFTEGKLEIRKLTMVQFADLLARFVDRPVIDMTELKGAYDATLSVTPEDYRAMQIRAAIGAGVQLPPQAIQLAAASSDESLHSALAALGLKLDPRKTSLDTLVVDSAAKSAAEN
jgi:uncharacterized protein (TIGR03435 family)